MSVDQIIQKTSEYLSVPSVVGHEKFFIDYIAQDFAKIGFQIEKHEGLLVLSGNDPDCAIVSAHLDRHGLISIGDGEYAYAAQYVKEIKYGQPNTSSQTELSNITSRFEGEIVYAYDPKTGEHMGQGRISSCQACMANGDAIFHVHDMPHAPLNTPVAYARKALEEDGYFSGQLDNTISLGALYALCQNGFQGTMLLTTEEEIGKSWRCLGDWLTLAGKDRKDLIIIDTSPYKDNQMIDEGRIVLRNRDKSEIFNADLVRLYKERCTALNIPYQVKDEYLLSEGKEITQLGSTELGRLISETSGRWSGATVQIPTVMYHTSNETTTRASIKNYYEFLQNILIEDIITL